VIHEPRRFLSYLNVSGKLKGTNVLFVGSDEPHCQEPFLKFDLGVVEHRAGPDVEIFASVFALVFVALALVNLGGRIKRRYRVSVPSQSLQMFDANLLGGEGVD